MDWLTRLPWIGPRVARAMRTHAWRAYAHLERVHWTRLAGAMTFSSFLALFPLIALTAAVGAALLSRHQLDTLENKISEQIPGIADQLDVHGLVANAGTVGGIAAAALAVTGVSWVSSLRGCLRAVWGKDDEGRNPFASKAVDVGILFGLGAAVLVSLAASGFATAAVDWAGDQIGLGSNSPGRALLTLVGYVCAVVADFLILTYMLTLLPSVDPPRRAVVVASLIGAVGLELLKVLLSGYLQDVAARNVYGAFGTPIALLLWINFMAKLLLYCAAWTATPVHAEDAADAEQAGDGDGAGKGAGKDDGDGEGGDDGHGRPGPAGRGGDGRDSGAGFQDGARDVDALDGQVAAGSQPEPAAPSDRVAPGPGHGATRFDKAAGSGASPVSSGGAGRHHASGARRWLRRSLPRSRRRGRSPRSEADGGGARR